MGILSSLITGTATQRQQHPRMGAYDYSVDPRTGWAFNAIASRSATGEFITPDIAMQVGAWAACVRVLAESVATTEFHAFEWVAEGHKERLPDDDPLEILIAQRPNATQTPVEFIETMMSYVAPRGLGIAEKIPGELGAVTEIRPIHPDLVTPVRAPDWTTSFKILGTKDAPARTLLQDEVFFLRDMSFDAVNGFPRADRGRDTIALARAAERYGGAFFANSAQPAGQLTTPNRISELTAQQLSDSWKRAHGDGKSQGTAVLWDGMKFETISPTMKQTQFLESRKFSVIEICRLFRVPPHMIQDLDRAILNNITGLAIQFVTLTLMKWFRLIEQAVKRDLIVDRPNVFVEFDVRSLMRGDPITRATFNEIGLRTQTLTPNEVRLEEGKPPLPGGDETILQPTEAGPREQSQPAQLPPADDNANAIATVSQDIAQRLANGEAQRLQRRAGKAADDPDQFRVWAVGELDKTRGHIVSALAPMVLLGTSIGGYDVDGVTDAIVADGVVNLAAYTNGGVVQSERAAAINQRILEGIDNGNRNN